MLSLVVMKTHRLEPLLNPDSIAIVGASNNAARIGGMPIAHLTKFGYQGQIYPINPKYQEVFGLRCWPDIEALPADESSATPTEELINGVAENDAAANSL